MRTRLTELRNELTQLPLPDESPLWYDDQTVIPGLPLAKLLTVTIVAHNEAGDSAASAPATITLG